MFLVYVLVVHLAFVLLLPLVLLHPKLRQGVRARFGFPPAGWPGLEGTPRIWFHGASAGDLLAIQPMLIELKRRLPGCAVLVTTVTNSGMAVLEQGLVAADSVGFLPYDLPWSVRRVVRRVRPDALVLEYAEVWPALIRGVARAGARLMITNGRFHERALGRYRLLYRLIGNPLRRVDLLCMRDQAEADHAASIGAPPDRIRVTGNTKFDRVASGARPDEQSLDGLRSALGIGPGDRIWVAGSTHAGEEGPLLEQLVHLRETQPRLRLIVAPRYLERTERVVSLATERGLACGRRSTGASDEPVVVLDSVGELAQVYHLAEIVFIGGSFVPRGGQNILEPAACGKPVLFGPHMENFADSVRVLIGRGGLQVPDPERLGRTLGDLLAQPDEIAKLGRMASQAVRSTQGASRANVDALLELLGQAGEGDP